MGLFDDIFGGFFDFNGDGKTTLDEEWLGSIILEEIFNATKEYEDSTDYDDSL